MNTNIIIRIPEPCHEDWNKMTPDDKGRFCSSCNKSVHDFTNKTDIEIREILLKNQGEKMCGHFRKSQLDRPLNLKINLNQLPKNMSVTKVFMIATFFVFGSMLFSCYDNSGKKIEKIEVSEERSTGLMIRPEMEEKSLPGQMTVLYSQDSISQCTATSGEMILEPGTVDGAYEVATVIERPEVFSGGAPVIEEVEVIKGDFVSEPADSVIGKKTIQHIPDQTDSVLDKVVTNINSDSAGMNKETTQVNTKSSSIKNVHSSNTNAENNTFEIFPNPSSGEFTVNYELKKRSDVLLEIYDDQGKKVKSLVNISSQYEGRYRIPVNIKDLNNGIYLVSLISEGKKTVKKIVLEK